MADTVTISPAMVERARLAMADAAPGEELYAALKAALSSPPPSSGLREALHPFAETAAKYDADAIPGAPAVPDYVVISDLAQAAKPYLTVGNLRRARAALASSDDGWVRVTEEAPLPDDLKIGDEVRSDWIGTIKRLPLDRSSPKRITHYRRRPSAEQGG